MTEYICRRCTRVVDADLELGGRDGRCPDCTSQAAREDDAIAMRGAS